MSNAELGRRVEHALAEHLGFTLAHPHDSRGPFDLLRGRDAYEVKSVTRGAGEYKCKAASAAMRRKRAAADEGKLNPHVLIAVVDPDTESVHAYSRPGLGAFRLTGPHNGWCYEGTAPISLN
jgi:hypothetical protein